MALPIEAKAAAAACLLCAPIALAQPARNPNPADIEGLAAASPGQHGLFFDGGRRLPQGSAVVALSQAGDKAPDSGELRQEMLRTLDFIESAFRAQYGPTLWKQSHGGWSLEREIQKARAKVAAGVTLKEYQRIVKAVFDSTQDYHVGVRFAAAESAQLPFAVVGANGRYFIAWIDRAKLPESSFPFHEGDELVSFGNRSAADAVAEVLRQLGQNTPETNQALASLRLTSRDASSGMDVPQGPVVLGIKRVGSPQVVTHQVVWDHAPEVVFRQPTRMGAELASLELSGLGALDAPSPSRLPLAWLDNALVDDVGGSESANPYGLGSRESFLPSLGVKLWESDNDKPFHAYLFRSGGKVLGYVRIPSYVPANTEEALKHFGEVIKKFEEASDGLIIDQLNNPGGSVFYLYALASMLSDQALAAPRHRIAITRNDAVEAGQWLQRYEAKVKNDADAKKALGPTIGGYPVSYEVFLHIVEFYRFVVAQWKAGRRLTAPVWLYGVDHINPSAVARYTKPILLLTNQLDFSGGDFFPAIMQDNRRAVIFGARTAGAGGFVRDVTYPNQLGIWKFRLTGSIAERVDKNPIENLGVRPDIEYTITPADLQSHYQGYIKAVNEAMASRVLGRKH